MTPGRYLRLRREASGLSIGAAARNLACVAPRPTTQREIQLLTARLGAVEADAGYLTPPQAGLLLQVFRFDPAIYEQLFTVHTAGEAASKAWGLPIPQVCRVCGCSWQDPCNTAVGACSWSADPTLCTRCTQPAPSPCSAPMRETVAA